MITISKNPNFSQWWDIRFLGKLIDNAKTESKAYEIANRIEKETRQKTLIINTETI
jgi:hypothetical protein